MRGVGAGRSAQRGTSEATTGPQGARSAPPNPEEMRFLFSSFVLLFDRRQDCWVGERCRVAEDFAFGDVAEETAHDLGAAGFGQLGGEEDFVWLGDGADLLADVIA